MNKYSEMLRERRLALGASVEEVADWSRIRADRIREIESGEVPTVTEFDFVSHGLGVSSTALHHGTADSPRRSIARFRSSFPTGRLRPRDLRLLSLAAEIGRTLGGLSRMLDLPIQLAEYRAPRGVEDSRPAWVQGYELAERARRDLPLSEGPLPDVSRSFRELGIHVIDVPLSDPGIEGASLWEPGSVPVILINESAERGSYPPSRRAILAHELCHLLHDGGEGDIETRISHETVGDPVERRARAFAPAFLAPRPQVLAWRRSVDADLPPQELVVALARTWGLSFEGAVWHAKNCDLLPESTARELVKGGPPGLSFLDTTIEASLGEDHRPAQLPVPPSVLTIGLGADLVAAALEASEITSGRAREILSRT